MGVKNYPSAFLFVLLKMLLIAGVLSIYTGKVYSQRLTSHDGKTLHYSSIDEPRKTGNGNSTLGVSFDTTLCGLNYIQAIQNTQTRFALSMGCGFPAPDTVSGLPAGCFKIIKAYLYCEVSCWDSFPSEYSIVDTITNPLNIKSTVTPILIGSSISKCWTDFSTGTWRADITSAITGNGVYTVNFSGFGGASYVYIAEENYQIDGISMIIIYQQNDVTYTGTFILSDGEYTLDGAFTNRGTAKYTATGFSACAASSKATAFTDFADVEKDAEDSFAVTQNGTTAYFPALFFQSAPVSTSVTSGQNSSTTTVTLPIDCYAMFMYGLYFQTSCLTCSPLSLPFTIKTTPTPCGYDSGIAKVMLKDTTGVTYHWSNGSTRSFISGLGAGTYTVIVTGPGGCPVDTAVAIIAPPDSVFASITQSKDSLCYGDSLTLSGAGGGKYLWSPGAGTTSSIHVTPYSTTTYTLRTYNGTCIDSAKVTIKVIPKITDTLIAINDTVCPHGTTKLITAVRGGLATYLWSNGATTTSITVNDTVTTTYTVIASGACNNVKKTINVTVIPLPKPVIIGLNRICEGVKDTLTVGSVTNPTRYVWSNGKTTSTIIIEGITNDSLFSVTAYNSLGCSVLLTDTLIPRQAPNVTVNPPTIFCPGQPIMLSALATGTNAPFSYTWSTGQTGSTITIDPGPDSATTYTVQVFNGCVGKAATTAIPNVPLLNACCNQTLLIEHDTATLVATGNSVKYQWIDADQVVCLNPPLCDSVRVNPAVTTAYTVIGTDSNGCQAEKVILISIEVPCFDLIIPNVFTPANAGLLGLDNVFYIKTENVDAWSLIIYDRWGKEMYHTSNPLGYWTGNTEEGSEVPAGVYYYVINATCQNTAYKKDGFVQLIR